jgi:hypothetical protein
MGMPWGDAHAEDILSVVAGFLGPLLASELRCLSHDTLAITSDQILHGTTARRTESQVDVSICDLIVGNAPIDDYFAASALRLLTTDTSMACDASCINLSTTH